MRPLRLTALLGSLAVCALLVTGCQSGNAAAPAVTQTPAAVSSSSTTTIQSQASDAVPESSTAARSSAAASALPTTPAATKPVIAQGAGAPSSAAACSLINQQEASSAIGSAAGVGSLSGNVAAGYTACQYDATNGSLSVYLVTVNGKADFLHATSKTSGHVSKVPGIGDGAFGTFADAHAAIEFYRGDTLVTVILITTSGNAKDKAVALATTAAGRVS